MNFIIACDLVLLHFFSNNNLNYYYKNHFDGPFIFLLAVSYFHCILYILIYINAPSSGHLYTRE